MKTKCSEIKTLFVLMKEQINSERDPHALNRKHVVDRHFVVYCEMHFHTFELRPNSSSYAL